MTEYRKLNRVKRYLLWSFVLTILILSIRTCHYLYDHIAVIINLSLTARLHKNSRSLIQYNRRPIDKHASLEVIKIVYRAVKAA